MLPWKSLSPPWRQKHRVVSFFYTRTNFPKPDAISLDFRLHRQVNHILAIEILLEPMLRMQLPWLGIHVMCLGGGPRSLLSVARQSAIHVLRTESEEEDSPENANAVPPQGPRELRKATATHRQTRVTPPSPQEAPTLWNGLPKPYQDGPRPQVALISTDCTGCGARELCNLCTTWVLGG